MRSRYYTSFPFTSSATSGASFLSHAWTIFTQAISIRYRPWVDLVDLSSFDLPYSLEDVLLRLKHNLRYFRLIYVLAFLLILFLTLLWYPLLMIIFLPFLIAWFFLYFFRHQPLVVFHRVLDDSLMLTVLWLVTAVSLLLYGVWLNVLLSLFIGVGFVASHATLRKTDDLYMMGEQEASDGGLHSAVPSPPSPT